MKEIVFPSTSSAKNSFYQHTFSQTFSQKLLLFLCLLPKVLWVCFPVQISDPYASHNTPFFLSPISNKLSGPSKKELNLRTPHSPKPLFFSIGTYHRSTLQGSFEPYFGSSWPWMNFHQKNVKATDK